MENYGKSAAEILSRIRTNKPVVHSITNYVVMNSTANVLLAIGASPIMAHAAEEMEDIEAISTSMVINIGTLSKQWIEVYESGLPYCERNGKAVCPVCPVGAGATKVLQSILLATSLNLYKPTVVLRVRLRDLLSLPKRGTTRAIN